MDPTTLCGPPLILLCKKIALVHVFIFTVNSPNSFLVSFDIGQMLMTQLDPLTEQQVMGIYSLQQSSQQAEEALSQGLEQLQQSLVDTIAGGSVSDSMHHMAVALGKITNLEGFVRQVKTLILD